MTVSIESTIEGARNIVSERDPDMLFMFDTYANEARFARDWLDEELRNLTPQDKILEVGAGMLLLACHLTREGFPVTALEPLGDGYSHMYRLQQCVLHYMEREHIHLERLTCPAEQLEATNRFTLAYSIHVMEHVSHPDRVLDKILAALKPQGCYRFMCPNYHFPYEAHFMIPTFGSKAMTWRLMKQQIIHAKHMEDPQGVWDSINWIRVSDIRRICKRLAVQPVFNRQILAFYIERALKDPIFIARHKTLCALMRLAQNMRLLLFTRFIPSRLVPVMDCRVTPQRAAS